MATRRKTTPKVAATTMLKDPTGALVTLKADTECPEWALGRVQLHGDDETSDTVTDET